MGCVKFEAQLGLASCLQNLWLSTVMQKESCLAGREFVVLRLRCRIGCAPQRCPRDLVLWRGWQRRHFLLLVATLVNRPCLCALASNERYVALDSSRLPNNSLVHGQSFLPCYVRYCGLACNLPGAVCRVTQLGALRQLCYGECRWQSFNGKFHRTNTFQFWGLPRTCKNVKIIQI